MFGLLCAFACAVCSVVVGVSLCKKLGILKNETKPEELGDRALQAWEDHGIRPQDYEGRYDEYMKKIEEIPIDPEKSKKYTDEQKLKAAGEIVGFALREHYGKNSGVETFVKNELNDETKKDFYTPERTKEYLDVCVEQKVDMGKIGDYLDDKLDSMAEDRAMGVKLIEAEKKLGVSEQEAKDNIEKERDRRAE